LRLTLLLGEISLMYMWFFIGIGLIFISDRTMREEGRRNKEEEDKLLKQDKEWIDRGEWGPRQKEDSESHWQYMIREQNKRSDEQWLETTGFMVVGVILVVVNLIRMAWSLFHWVLGAP